MGKCGALYDGVEWVTETIRLALSQKQLINRIKSAFSTASHQKKNWGNFITAYPTCYLRLAITMDLSFSHGRLPQEKDFPIGLQDKESDGDPNGVISMPGNLVEGFTIESISMQRLQARSSGRVNFDSPTRVSGQEMSMKSHPDKSLNSNSQPSALDMLVPDVDDEYGTLPESSALPDWLQDLDGDESPQDTLSNDGDEAVILTDLFGDDWVALTS
jgi:hypothetical protein